MISNVPSGFRLIFELYNVTMHLIKTLLPIASLFVSLANPLYCQLSVPKQTIITFGSCAQEDKPQPILQMAAALKPDMFIYLGDNIYGDTYDMQELKAKYQMLASKAEFQELKKSTKILATWDDHDFGWNDSGRHYPMKEASKEMFMNFFEEPENSTRRKREGIYASYYFTYGERVLQLILLDTRTFRDNLRLNSVDNDEKTSLFYTPDYLPYATTDSTLLGSSQWTWLEQELTKKADIRIIGSSTQFGIEYNGYEAWANFPHEMDRIVTIIKQTGAEGVIFMSGDVHYAEISRRNFSGLYPIYDFTSSGITSTWDFATPNIYRIEGPVMENHFGKLTIAWDQPDPVIKMEAIDASGNQRFEYTITLSELTFGGK
jgi:alkaline phosphatase D